MDFAKTSINHTTPTKVYAIDIPLDALGRLTCTLDANAPLKRSLDWLHTLQARFEEIAEDVGCNDCNQQIPHILSMMSQELKAAAGKALEVSEQIDWTLVELESTVHKEEKAPAGSQLLSCPTIATAESSAGTCE